jgi:protein-L-isoaspartate(D-aspartate) O-methyltransferase
MMSLVEPPLINNDAKIIRLIMTLRNAGINDTQVLSAIERTPREVFVPETFRDQAYDDIALPIGRGQTISQPFVVAAMTQALDIGDRDKVLEIGTGSGYQAAILARLCRRLYTIERHKPLLQDAQEIFDELRLHNIT